VRDAQGTPPRGPFQILKRVSPPFDMGLGFAIVVCGLVIWLAFWFTSAGHFPTFPRIQNDYLELGDAFLHGQTALLDLPDPRLAELGNPYDYSQRKHLKVHWDASYYDGRYYLYWGPVPALVSAGLEGITGRPPPAAVLTLLAYLGLLGTFPLLLMEVSHTSGYRVPRLSFGLFLLLGFVNLPLLNVIGSPRIYQTSILYGQFFLLAGLLGVLLAIRRRSPGWLLLGSLGWGLALGSRYNLVFAVALQLVFAAGWIWHDGGWTGLRTKIGLLLGPMVLCLVALGAYNYVRFNNPLETGLTYQLTIPELAQQPYALRYIPSNLYLYTLYPLTSAQTFPFIQSAHFRTAMLPAWLPLPPGRQIDQIIMGVLPTVPALWLLLLALPLGFVWLRSTSFSPRTPRDRLKRISTTGGVVAGTGAVQFMFLLVFFYATERYVADFYLPAILCMAMISWQIDKYVLSHTWLRTAFWLSVVLLTFWTAGIGYFSCFGVPSLSSNHFDPIMISNAANFWNAARTGVASFLP